MKIIRHSILLALALGAAPVIAAEQSFTFGGQHTDFSSNRGDRTIVEGEYATDLGATKFILGAAHGRRDYGEGADFSGTRVDGSVYHDWNDKITTRTYATWGSNDPVFINRNIGHTFYLKLIPRTVFTAGITDGRYFGDIDMRTYSGGVSYYFDRVTASYRYTSYQVENFDNTSGHLVSIRLKDAEGRGHTQLWLGKGSSSHDLEFLEDIVNGDRRDVTLRRVQPLSDNLALNASFGRTWYERPTGDYEGNTVNVGLTYNW